MIVLHIDNAAIGYDQPLASNINLNLQRDMKVAIIGANGIGKSTLLKTIVGQVPRFSG